MIYNNSYYNNIGYQIRWPQWAALFKRRADHLGTNDDSDKHERRSPSGALSKSAKICLISNKLTLIWWAPARSPARTGKCAGRAQKWASGEIYGLREGDLAAIKIVAGIWRHSSILGQPRPHYILRPPACSANQDVDVCWPPGASARCDIAKVLAV